MNGLVVPTIVIAMAFFHGGGWLWQRAHSYRSKALVAMMALVLAAPGILFAVYFMEVHAAK